MTGPTFRSAGPGDVESVVALVESAYRGESSRAGWTTEADLLDGRRTDAAMVTGLLGRPGSTVVLAEGDPGELLGCCHVQVDGAAAHFGLFAVRPDRQGRGTGRALLRRAEQLAAAAGAGCMEMEVLRQRPDLVAWYQRCGYRPTGATRPFPSHDRRFGLPKREDLVFDVLERAL